MIIYGIDPGLNGGIASLEVTRLSWAVRQMEVWKMPTIQAKKRRHLDAGGISDVVMLHCDHVYVIEQQQTWPRDGRLQAFSTGYQFGWWLGYLHGMRIEIVTSKKWQKEFGIAGDTKEGSIALASRMFPQVSLKASDRCRKDHDGIADAMCLAEYGRRVLR